MRRDRNIDFTDVGHSRRHVGVRVALIVLVVFLLGGASFFVILERNDFEFSRFLGARTGDETTREADVSETAAPQGKSAEPFTDPNALNLLFLCKDDDELVFCMLASFSEQENAVYIRPVPPEHETEWNGHALTLSQLAVLYGEEAAASSFQDLNVRVSRTVCMTPAVFRQIVQTLGEAPITVPRDVSFSVDGITYTLNAGEQTLKPDVLLDYMRYAFTGDEHARAQGEVFAALFRAHLTEENVLRGEEFFSSLISRTTGNLTVFDYAAKKDAALRFVRQSPAIEVIC